MKERQRYVRSGFTMVELMAVLIILGLLAGVVVKSFMTQVDKAKVKTTMASLKLLHSAINEFYMNCWTVARRRRRAVRPDRAASGCRRLARRRLPGDDGDSPGRLGQRFRSMNGIPESGKPFVIISYGADAQEGGEGYDADLKSTDAK